MALPLRPTMALTRLGAGALSWAQPERATKAFGLPGPTSDYTARLFGIRDIALGLGVMSRKPAVRKATLRLAMLCDAADCAAGVLEAKAGKTTPAGSALLIGGAAAFVVMGALALSRED